LQKWSLSAWAVLVCSLPVHGKLYFAESIGTRKLALIWFYAAGFSFSVDNFSEMCYNFFLRLYPDHLTEFRPGIPQQPNPS
jgi:hypothetical protein